MQRMAGQPLLLYEETTGYFYCISTQIIEACAPHVQPPFICRYTLFGDEALLFSLISHTTHECGQISYDPLTPRWRLSHE